MWSRIAQPTILRLKRSMTAARCSVSVAPRPFILSVRSLGSAVRRVIFGKGAHIGRPFGRHKTTVVVAYRSVCWRRSEALSGSSPERRHHSQVRMHPWTTFFNGDCASNKLTAATLPAAEDSTRLFLPRTGAHGPGQFIKMSRSMHSRSFSWGRRAISEAWSADIGVACVVGRHAAHAGSRRNLSTQRRRLTRRGFRCLTIEGLRHLKPYMPLPLGNAMTADIEN